MDARYTIKKFSCYGKRLGTTDKSKHDDIFKLRLELCPTNITISDIIPDFIQGRSNYIL